MAIPRRQTLVQKASALATRGRHATMHTAGRTRVLVTIGLEHARLLGEQLGIQARQPVELGIAVRAGGRVGIARPVFGSISGHGRVGRIAGARATLGAIRGAPAIGILGAAGIFAGIFGMPPALGIFGPGILGALPLAITLLFALLAARGDARELGRYLRAHRRFLGARAVLRDACQRIAGVAFVIYGVAARAFATGPFAFAW